MTVLLALALLFHVVGLLSSVHAVMSTRTPQGTIAWAIALNTFPYLAVPAYWVLGRNRFQGYVDTRRSSEGELADLAREVAAHLAPHRTPDDRLQDAPAGRAAERLADMPYLDGNAVELLVDGNATFASILEGIDAATEYILFQFFIVKDDRIGREVKERLITKARQGVRVLFLYDEVGSRRLPRAYVQALRDAGAEALPFNTRQGPGNRFQINFRNHRKIGRARDRGADVRMPSTLPGPASGSRVLISSPTRRSRVLCSSRRSGASTSGSSFLSGRITWGSTWPRSPTLRTPQLLVRASVGTTRASCTRRSG